MKTQRLGHTDGVAWELAKLLLREWEGHSVGAAGASWAGREVLGRS